MDELKQFTGARRKTVKRPEAAAAAQSPKGQKKRQSPAPKPAPAPPKKDPSMDSLDDEAFVKDLLRGSKRPVAPTEERNRGVRWQGQYSVSG